MTAASKRQPTHDNDDKCDASSADVDVSGPDAYGHRHIGLVAHWRTLLRIGPQAWADAHGADSLCEEGRM